MLDHADQRAAVLAEAATWFGTPHIHQARVKHAGVDCGQYLIAVYSAAGVGPEIATDPYPADWMMHREEERFLAHVAPHAVEVEQPQAGDIVVFRIGRCFSHGGIVIDERTFWHSRVNGSVCIGEFDEFRRTPKRFFSPFKD